MSLPPLGPYPLPIGVGDAERLTQDGWVAILRAAPATWAGSAADSYLVLRDDDLEAARLARDRVADAAAALRLLHASRTTAFLALQGLAPATVGVEPAGPAGDAPSSPVRLPATGPIRNGYS